MSEKKGNKDIFIEEFLQVKLEKLVADLSSVNDHRKSLYNELEELDEYYYKLEYLIDFLENELNYLKQKNGCSCDDGHSCSCDEFFSDITFSKYPEVDTYKYYSDTCSGKCSSCKKHEENEHEEIECEEDEEEYQDDDSQIMTVADLSNTINIEDKSPEHIMNELVIFTDEQVEEAITLAIWEYANNNLSDSVVSKFTMRGFIKYLESKLSKDNEVEVDVDINLAEEILAANNGVYKISEGLYGRFQ